MVTPSTRAGENTEPASYHAIPVHFWEHLFDAFGIKQVYDLTPCDGPAATAALNLKLPYIGICVNDAHVKLLRQRLIDTIKTNYTSEGHSLYIPLAPKRGLSQPPQLQPPKKAKEEDLPTPKKQPTPEKPTGDKEDTVESGHSSDSGNSA